MHKPSYYTVTPAHIRYDKSLPPFARLLYGEITALANKRGYCDASNGWLAKQYEVTPQAVSGWIRQLAEKGHLVLIYEDGEYGMKCRKIYLSEAYRQEFELLTDVYPPKQQIKGGINNGLRGYKCTINQNNTRENNTRENKADLFENRPDPGPKPVKKKVADMSDNEKMSYRLEKAKAKSYEPDIRRVVDYFRKASGKNVAYSTKDALDYMVKRMKKDGYTADDLTLVIDYKVKQLVDRPEYINLSTFFRDSLFEGNLEKARMNNRKAGPSKASPVRDPIEDEQVRAYKSMMERARLKGYDLQEAAAFARKHLGLNDDFFNQQTTNA